MATTIPTLTPPEPKAERSKTVSLMAARAFFRIGKDWQCNESELTALIGVGLIQLLSLRKQVEEESITPLDRRTLIRIRCLVMLYKETAHRHGSIALARNDMRASRGGLPFMGQTPIQYMVRQGLKGIVETTRAVTGGLPDLKAPVTELFNQSEAQA